MTRTRTATTEIARGRLAKAKQFLDAAQTLRDLADDEAAIGDALVTLCVHAGIAAADAICCVALGEHSRGESHDEAVKLIKRVRPDGNDLGNALNALLAMKTRAAYGSEPVSGELRLRARRGAERLVSAATDRVPKP
jgi:hypothetical protein